MLREIVPVRQVSGEPRRRWFMSVDLELITWHEASGALIGFQLCYNRQSDEHAITWRHDCGFVHDSVDSGESEPDANRTPVLLADGAFDAARVSEFFHEASAALEADLRDQILDRLASYSS